MNPKNYKRAYNYIKNSKEFRNFSNKVQQNLAENQRIRKAEEAAKQAASAQAAANSFKRKSLDEFEPKVEILSDEEKSRLDKQFGKQNRQQTANFKKSASDSEFRRTGQAKDSSEIEFSRPNTQISGQMWYQNWFKKNWFKIWIAVGIFTFGKLIGERQQKDKNDVAENQRRSSVYDYQG